MVNIILFHVVHVYIYICQRERSTSIQTIHAWDATMAQDPTREQNKCSPSAMINGSGNYQ